MMRDTTVLVTGASGGIGQAIAVRFAEEGADIGVHYYRNHEGADATAEQVRATGANAAKVQGDISDPDEATQIVTAIRGAHSPIDVLINNAGTANRTPWDRLTWEEWTDILAVNVGGVFNVSREVLPAMAARGSGAVVNVSSTWSLIGGDDLPAYTASKGAINALTRQMCKSYSPHGIRINVISPGPIDIEKHRDRREKTEGDETVRRRIPLGRYGEPREVAEAARFLASNQAGFITGTNLVVDGGLTATSSR